MAAKRGHKDIDDLFREGFEDFSVEPGTGVRSELLRKVGRKEFLRFNPARFNVYYLAAAAATVGLSLVLTFSDISLRSKTDIEPVKEEPVLIEKQSDQAVVSSNTLPETLSDEPVVAGNIYVEARRPVSVAKSVEKPDTRIKQSYTVKIDPPTGSGITRIITVTETTDLKSVRQVPVSSIKASAVEGCAPILIKFQSTSEDYRQFVWTSSDGRRSEAKDVEWLFIEPGDHKIILQVTDKDGKDDYSSVDVTVH